MLRLGLDLGTNSIGWVLYQLDRNDPPEPCGFVDGGVLIFSDGRNPKNRQSNAAERRTKRGPRRNRDRMLRRRARVARLLHEANLLPSDDVQAASLRNLDPLRLRAESLDRPLEPYELGRVLLSFADRRGFKSNRKTDGGEDGKIRQEVRELRRRILQSGARTLGEYLWKRHKKGKTTRARLGNGLYPDRAMIQDELEAIQKAQSSNHPNLKRHDWDQIIDALMFQRALRPVDRGNCTLLPDEKRAHKAYPVFQHFRIWQDVLNIKVASPSEDGTRSLNENERNRIVEKLLTCKERTFDQLVADANLEEGTRINLESTAREKLEGDSTAVKLRSLKCFGKEWSRLTLERQQVVLERLLEEDDYVELESWLRDEFSLSEKAAEAVAGLNFVQGTSHLSKKAINKLLPHMKTGFRYDEAVVRAQLGHHSDHRGDGRSDSLPYYGSVLERHVVGRRQEGRNDAEKYGRVANPTVHIALGQVRRLFNAITEQHGKPDQVIVELARDLKQSLAERSSSEKRQKLGLERNERLRDLARQANVPEPSSGDLRKLRLWDEQGKVNARICPFTGQSLSVELVLSAATEIEHLLPFSRSLDDSMNNKVVVMRDANREKGNRTPFEAWGHDPVRWEKIRSNVKHLPIAKQWRFDEDAMEKWEGKVDFLDRQLTDNRYLSRMVKEYLEYAVNPNNIWVTPGRMTSMVRHRLGLNNILNDENEGTKNRADHRHHLIDAAVIGITSRSQLQKVARAMGKGEDGQRIIEKFHPPWDGYRSDLEALVERCVVWHRPDHFKFRAGYTTGSLHNETAYGIIEGPDTKGIMTLVETKTLDAINLKRLDDVRDLNLRERLKGLYAEIGDANSGAGNVWKVFVSEAERRLGVRRVRVLVRLGSGSLAFIFDKAGQPYKAYKTDGNAFMDIWLLPNGKTKGETISRFVAHKPNARSEVKANYPTARKLMRLHINDMVAIGNGEERRIYRVQKLAGSTVVAVDHVAAGKASELLPLRKSAGQILQSGLRKVSVDVLGRVKDGGPFH